MENIVLNTAATDFEALKLEVHLDYIEGPRDPIIAELLQEMVQNAKDCMRGGGSRRRALFVIGPSGSGKSYSLRHHLARIPGFQKGLNIHGEEVAPLLSIEAPKPCTTKDLAIAILKALDIPARKRQTEGELFETVKTQLRERGILFLHIDEAQHLLRHKSKDAVLDVQDCLKTLMQMKEWPLHAIYSGVPRLALLRSDDELKNRSRVQRIYPIAQNDKPTLRGIVSGVAEKCEVGVLEEVLADDFLGRLCHAYSGSFGTIVEAVQAGCFLVKQRSASLDIRAFAYNYQRDSGCLPSDNIFRAARWSEIDPSNSLSDLEGI
ncbi:ATP-binding protein [Hoeflea sp. YIM 152468]|uniref:ATP-binding protein n=1 Tax=Hoeflea sp. YIM 152468 TaxID=3031759 RepID=UPI0023DAEF06|nr:ATP-binding protein [Hoeflea sp. YIM 152468]MDF1610041.1 ATP-binding protein [Hoeflea sp. YIM 152468]